jgi:molecular chaperone HtpG
MNKIKFEVETKRVLELLSNDIYDSPYALLRENIQNAYDAILMRHQAEPLRFPIQEGFINVDYDANSGTLRITDNGIGMNEETLKQNFWKPGSSGKRNELARQAGVVGTFGIGAMANFGVASRLEVRTRNIGSEQTLWSAVNREDLSISKECIDLWESNVETPYGTQVTVQMDHAFNVEEAQRYLEAYVQYIPVRVMFNDKMISCRSYHDVILGTEGSAVFSGDVEHSLNEYAASVMVQISDNGLVSCVLRNIRVHNQLLPGTLVLRQGGGIVMGLRNFFGLASTPLPQYYSLEGIADMEFLQPTAGREALSRESIDIIHQLIQIAEHGISDVMSGTEYADTNGAFMQYIYSHQRYELAGQIKIQIYPENKTYPLACITSSFIDRRLAYATIYDKSLVDSFTSGGIVVASLSQNSPRRQVQLGYIEQLLKIEKLPTEVQATKIYEEKDLQREELSFTFQLSWVLKDDYFLPNTKVMFAELTFGSAIHVVKEEQEILVYIQKGSQIVEPLMKFRDSNYGMYSAFVKDFAREYLYNRIASFIPSAVRSGTDAFYQLMQQQTDLYTLESNDIGDFEKLLSDYLSGDESFGNVISQVQKIQQSQTDIVHPIQVGRVEDIIPDLLLNNPVYVGTTSEEKGGTELVYEPVPAIHRRETETDKKILHVSNEYIQLNKFTTFLALSDRMYGSLGHFFLSPHSTRIIWASHKIIFVFTRLDQVTVYYDIQLKEQMLGSTTGGSGFPTTTIITKNKIFVPVPTILASAFNIAENGRKEYLVRYDYV